jgi:hypothetical protein
LEAGLVGVAVPPPEPVLELRSVSMVQNAAAWVAAPLENGSGFSSEMPKAMSSLKC